MCWLSPAAVFLQRVPDVLLMSVESFMAKRLAPSLLVGTWISMKVKGELEHESAACCKYEILL